MEDIQQIKEYETKMKDLNLHSRNIRTLEKLHHNKCRSKTKNLSQGLGIKFSIIESNNC